MRKRLVQPGGRHGRVLVGGQHPAFDDAHPAHPLPAGVGVGIHIVVVDVGGDVREKLIADLVRRAVENDEVDRHVVVQQELTDGVHRHAERLILGVAEDAGGDQREGYRLAVVLLGQRKARPVAGDKLLPLAVAAAVPHGADGVNHIPAGQAVGFGDLGVTCLAAAQRPTLGQQLRPCRTMDAAIHAASAQQGLLGRVDNGVHGHFRDVVANDD